MVDNGSITVVIDGSIRVITDKPKESIFFQIKFTLSQYRRTLVSEDEGVKKAGEKLFYAKFGAIKEALNYLVALDEPRLEIPPSQKGILLALNDIVTAHAIHKGSEDESHAESEFYLLKEEHKALEDFLSKYSTTYSAKDYSSFPFIEHRNYIPSGSQLE